MTDTPPLTIAILGTGALGTLMAWHWRHQCLYVYNRRQTTNFCLHSTSPESFQAPAWHGEATDWLVVTTKAADTASALESVESYLPAVKRLLLLQNGMGQQEQIRDWLQRRHTDAHNMPELWVASSTEGAYRREDGTVVYAGKGITRAGPWCSEAANEQTLLPPQITYAENIQQLLLEKLAINAVINPLTAYYSCHNGELLNHPERHRHFEALAEEITDLYSGLGWATSFSIPEQAEVVARATAKNQSSTFQDMLHQRPTELPYICGYLLSEAQKKNLKAPLTQELYQSLSAMEAAWH